MAWFNRNRAEQNVLPEIERYYDAEKRERAGMTWVLAGVSVACVALLLIGLFFGGRWIYRKTTDSQKTQGISANSGDSKGIAQSPDKKSDKTTGPSSDKGNVAPTSPTPSSSIPSFTVPATPTTNVATSKLADTGPADTARIFLVATLGFTALYQLFSRLSRKTR